MHTHLVAVGKLRQYYRDACDEYLKRLEHYGPVSEREVREARGKTAQLCRRDESDRLLGALPRGAVLVALDRGGTAWSSEELARRLERWRGESAPIALLIGGANGLVPELLRQAGHRWSLGPLTLPHQLARVVVLEQWYRAWTIIRGEPYHKG